MEELKVIIIGAVGCIISGLAAYAVNLFKAWMNSKIKDKKVADMMNKALDIVTGAVKQVYQVFVEALKAEGKFDEAKQREAKEAAKAIIKKEMTPELVSFVNENYGVLEDWINNQIETVLYNLKNNK